MTFIIHADMELWDFMLAGLKGRKDVKDFPLNRYCNIFQRFMRNRYREHHLPYYMIFGFRLYKELKNLRSGDNVIISAYTQRNLFNAIKHVVKDGVVINLWMWNPVSSSSTFKKSIELLKQDNVKLHTFDTKDAADYGMTHHCTFYNMRYNNPACNIEYDFYFLGAKKNRINEINHVQSILKRFKCNFIIPIKDNDFITYKENLINIQKSRCIVDIVQNNQYDITLRPLEALAYRKKLITNNIHIKKYPFYNANNIFIINEDKTSDLDYFVNSTYVEIDEEIINQFDINTWVESFNSNIK